MDLKGKGRDWSKCVLHLEVLPGAGRQERARKVGAVRNWEKGGEDNEMLFIGDRCIVCI